MTDEQLAAEFPLGPDSLPQPGVPRGKVEKFTHAASSIFPGTVRDCYLYVPAGHDPANPACVMVCQDGHDHLRPGRRWQSATILDNLIHQGAIPACIGIFIDPGVIPAAIPGGKPRPNRSFEYDSLSDRYVRFLLEEILPEVGRRYKLSSEGRDRLIMGGSSGAACAFNAAWHRPDAFQRVLSIVGSYTALRGGNQQSARVRLAEPKPIRVFLEGGAQDLVIFAGHWWEANLDMLAALEYAGYEVDHSWAEHAGHNDFHGTSIFPDALRWIWKDYPRAITAGVNSRQPVARVLAPGEGWQPVAENESSVGCLVAAADGAIIFARDGGGLFRAGAGGRAEPIVTGVDGVTDLALAPDGTLLACQPRLRRITAFDREGAMTVYAADLEAQSVAIAANGNRYVADPSAGGVWLISPDGARSLCAREVPAPRGVRLTPDQGQLIVTSARGRMGYLFMVQTDGALAPGAPCFRLNLPDEASDSGAEQMAVHPKGWSCLATTLGIQLACPDGTISGLISAPGPGKVTGVALGGHEAEDLYVSCGGKLYRRRILSPDEIWS